MLLFLSVCFPLSFSLCLSLSHSLSLSFSTPLSRSLSLSHSRTLFIHTNSKVHDARTTATEKGGVEQKLVASFGSALKGHGLKLGVGQIPQHIY